MISPLINCLTFSTAIFISRVRASNVAHAMWGVIKQLRAVSKGLSEDAGSTDSTSAPNAARCPQLSASATSLSLIRGPLPVFISIAPAFILVIVDLQIRLRVDSVSGQCKLITSDSASSRSRGVAVMPSGKSSWLFDVNASTFIPNDKAILAVAIPVFPKPTMPIVFLSSSMSGLSQ